MTTEAQPNQAVDDEVVIFISHASSDRQIAKLLKELFVQSLKLRADQVRCTSMPGGGVATGQNYNLQLARECTTVPVFVALLSYRFLVSPYPMFELGARWGSSKDLIPIRLRGFPASRTPTPIAAVQSTDASSEIELQKMILRAAGALALGGVPHTTAREGAPNPLLAQVAQLNRGWHRIRPPSARAFAVAAWLCAVLVALVAFRFWSFREDLRPQARKCRDGIERLVRVRPKTAADQGELARAIITDTTGCVDFLSLTAESSR